MGKPQRVLVAVSAVLFLSTGCAGLPWIGKTAAPSATAKPAASPSRSAAQPSATPSARASATPAPTVTVTATAPGQPPAPQPPAPAPPNATTDVTGKDSNFFSPTGNLMCGMNDDTAFCLVRGVQWGLKTAPGCGPGMTPNGINLADQASLNCWGGIPYDPALDNATANGWWRAGEDPLALNDPNAQALGYGRTLRSRNIECTMAETGVTCRNTATGGGFTANRQTYAMF